MFTNLSERLSQALRDIKGTGRITEENIQDALREIRRAFLEADVALEVIRTFTDEVKNQALGQEIKKSLTPGQVFVKIVNKELVKVLGEENSELNLNTQPPAVILMAGLQGCGKTTTVAKLAKWLKERKNKNVLVTSTDIYRPAAIEQLSILAKEVDVHFFPSDASQSPVTIAQNAIDYSKKNFIDVVLIDTAGRLHIDEEMMKEIREIHQALSPIETLLVVDSMTGQDAANTAKVFHEALPLTGVILTKIDGDARGGAALSMRTITGKPIKFIGTGEKTGAIEPFYPDRIASRILGMGDIVSLVEEVEQKIDKEKAEKIARKLKKGKGFDLEDFREQLLQMKNMGGMMGLLNKLPGIGGLSPAALQSKMDDKLLVSIEAIINSMTPSERARPDIINGSRKRRIANGSGRQIQDVNRLLKQFTMMQKMMKKFGSPGKMAKLMRQLGGLGGIMPPGKFR